MLITKMATSKPNSPRKDEDVKEENFDIDACPLCRYY